MLDGHGWTRCNKVMTMSDCQTDLEGWQECKVRLSVKILNCGSLRNYRARILSIY